MFGVFPPVYETGMSYRAAAEISVVPALPQLNLAGSDPLIWSDLIWALCKPSLLCWDIPWALHQQELHFLQNSKFQPLSISLATSPGILQWWRDRLINLGDRDTGMSPQPFPASTGSGSWHGSMGGRKNHSSLKNGNSAPWLKKNPTLSPFVALILPCLHCCSWWIASSKLIFKNSSPRGDYSARADSRYWCLAP